jgi:hypothetical protein
MTNFLKVLDQAALALINILVVAGLPLAAVGIVTGAI